MRNRTGIIILFTALSVVWCLFPRMAVNAGNNSFHQSTRRKQTRRTVRANRSRARGNPARDYSKFSHRTEKHRRETCLACHKARTANWRTAAGFPDVADYPDHDACTRCHRSQFFKGALPVICSVCHTKVSPRSKARFAFGKPNQPSQFGIIFPHDKHQDILAFGGSRIGFESAHALRFASVAAEEKKPTYNNCAICHVTQDRTLNPQGGFEDNFVPPAGTFKTKPVDHASCFNCHWKGQEPTHENCKKCHGYSETDFPVLPAPIRKSLKFIHSREEHVWECTTCHINITRKTDPVDMRPDVPITSCLGSSCHSSQPTKPEKVTIATELIKRTDSIKTAAPQIYVCIKCHVREIGKRTVQPSHEAALK